MNEKLKKKQLAQKIRKIRKIIRYLHKDSGQRKEKFTVLIYRSHNSPHMISYSLD